LIINKEIYNNSNPPYSSIVSYDDATYTNFISKIENELSNTFPAELPDQSMEIYDTMDKIQSTNSSLRTVKSKISLKINEYKHFKENVLNDSIYLEIFSIVILVISGLLTILVIISNDKQVYLLYNMVFLMIVGMLFFIIYYYFYIYKNIQEYFDTASRNDYIIDYFNTKFANIMLDLNNTNVKVVNNIINEKSKNELDKYNRIYNKYNIYQNKVNNDLLLESLENKKRAINIFIILSFATFLILFNIAIIYNNIIIAGILIFFKIFLMMLYYYYDRSKFVNTSSNKYYWKQPENKF
jgi:Flp pilus assembly protein TadB